MCSQNAKLHFSPEEDEKLTEKVRKHPPLYDMQHALYRDTRVKDNIWKEIAENVERSVADCKKRWKNIRDTYDRKKREKTTTGSAAEPENKRRKWQLEERLSFLQTVENKRMSISNIHISLSKEAGFEKDIREEETDGPQVIDFVESHEESTTNVDVNSLPTISETSVKKVVTSTTKPKDSYKGNREKISSLLERRNKERGEIFKTLFAEEDDDVDLFYRSITKSVKKLRPDLRMHAKLQTLTLVANLENQMYDGYTNPPQNLPRATNASVSSPSTPTSIYSAKDVASPPTYNNFNG